MARHRIAAIGGDGIGQEVIAAGLEVLAALAAARAGPRARDHELRVGLGALPAHRPDDAGGRPRAAARVRCDLLRRRRRARHPRRRHALGPAPRDLPGLRPVRQRPPGAAAAGRQGPARGRGPGRPRLGGGAREHRGRVRRRRRARASRPAGGGRDRGRDLHPHGLRADHALRLRARPRAPQAAPDAGHQVERPAPRHGHVGRDLCRAREAVSRTCAPTRSWSTR